MSKRNDAKTKERAFKSTLYQKLKKSKEDAKAYEDAKDGDYASDIPIAGEKQIRTKMGDDGVEEHHTTYVKTKDKTRMAPLGDKYDQIDWSE